MTVEFVPRIIVVVLLLSFSAFFSGTETAFLSLSAVEKERLLRSAHGRRKRFLPILYETPDEVLITILTGNMVVNVFLTAISEALGAQFLHGSSELISIAVVTVVLILFGELTPKNIAVYNAPSFSSRAIGPVAIIHTLFRPLTAVLSRIRNFGLSFFDSSEEDDSEIHQTAVISAIRKGYRSGTLQETELKLLESYFELRNKCACDVMIPRIELPALELSTGSEEVLEKVGKGDGRYYLVYQNDVDHVAGFIDRIDLVPYYMTGEPFELRVLKRDLPAVYERMNLNELIPLMNDKQAPVMLVIDEYGGTEGIVTHRGIMEKLFEDFFPGGDSAFSRDPAGWYHVKGSVDIYELSEELGVEIESEARTVGGFLVALFDEIPAAGREVVHGNLHFKVEKVVNNRVVAVKVAKIAP